MEPSLAQLAREYLEARDELSSITAERNAVEDREAVAEQAVRDAYDRLWGAVSRTGEGDTILAYARVLVENEALRQGGA